MNGWTVMDRLGEIEMPTLVLAGRDDFIFPPEHQAQLAAGIRGSRLRIVDGAGHNPHDERTAEVMTAVAEFLLPPARQPVARETRSGRTVGPDGGRSGGAVLDL
jgi:pimeloyl-ACP methyl ester carboxylesterase